MEFLVGCEGEFDALTSTVVRDLMKQYGNCSLTLVLPYERAEIRKNEAFYLTRYTRIEVCEASAMVHYLSAYSVRNREVADRADGIICCITHESGGAWDAVKYAIKKENVS